MEVINTPMVNTLTCGELVVRDGGLVFCGQHAVFRYKGLIKTAPGLTLVHSLQRFGRITTDLCLDHSRTTFIRMEPALKSGEATMRCLEFTKLTLHCTACQSVYRFEPLHPTMVRSAAEQSPAGRYFLEPNHYCPVCGKPAVAEFNPTLDYWEIIAASLELPVAVTIDIYSHWMRDKQATGQFVEYIQALIAELDAEAQGA